MHDLEEHEKVYKILEIRLEGRSSSQTASRLRLHGDGYMQSQGFNDLNLSGAYC